MRIRQVKPAFWSDPMLATLTEATRLFYVGCWMVADDAGWMKLDVAEVAHDLYGYEPRSRRERRVAEMFASLVKAGRVVTHPCGHSEIPTLAEHQRLAAPTKQVRTVFNEHLKHCVSAPPRVSPQVPAPPRVSPLIPGTERNGTERLEERERNGTERNGSAGASANDGEQTEFQRLVGLPSALGGRS